MKLTIFKSFFLALAFAIFLGAQPIVIPSEIEASFGRNPVLPVALVDTATIAVTDPNYSPFYFNVEIEEPYNNYVIVQYSGIPTVGISQTVWVYVNTMTFPAGEHTFDVKFVGLGSPATTATLQATVTIEVNDPNIVFPGSDVVIVPHLANGDGWFSDLVISNLSNEYAAYFVEFFDSDGEPWRVNANGRLVRSYTVSLFPNNTYRLWLSPAPGSTSAVGSARVTPIEGPTALVTTIFQNDADVAAIQNLPATGSAFVMQYDNQSPTATGVAISNSLSISQTVTLTFFDERGYMYLVDQVEVAANGQTAFMLTDYPETTGKFGIVKISTFYPTLSTFGLVFDTVDLTFYATAVTKVE